MLSWKFLHPKMTHEALGFLPMFLNEDDPRPAKDQLHENYGHGGGWSPIPNFRMLPGMRLVYPGDPPIAPLAKLEFRDEVIYFYPHAFVMILQPNFDFEIARMD